MTTTDIRPPELIEITPAIAKSFLERNIDNNRTIRPGAIEKIAADIVNGRWDHRICNPIRFDREGRLIDGQHRLLAVIRAGIAVMMWVEREVESLHIDEAQRRTVADTLTMTGLAVDANPWVIQSMIKSITAVNNARQRGARWTSGSLGQLQVSNEASIAMFKAVPTLSEDSREAIRLHRGQAKMARAVGPTTIGVLLHFARLDANRRDDAITFLLQVTEGINILEGDPAGAYRRWALNGARQARQPLELAACMHALRCQFEGKSLKVLKVAAIGDVSQLPAALA